MSHRPSIDLRDSNAPSSRRRNPFQVPGRVVTIIATLTLLVLSSTGAPNAGAQTIDPKPFEAIMCPGDTETFELTAVLTDDPPVLDVVLALDNTGSMSATITEMKYRAIELMESISETHDDVQFAVVSSRDYPFTPYGGTGDWAFRVNQKMTSDSAAISEAIRSMAVGGGGDGPESYSRVLYEAAHPDNLMGWRDGSRKELVIFGDQYPHDDDLCEGSPPAPPGCPWVTGRPPTYLDPGRDGDMGSSEPEDDIDFQPALLDLDETDITLLFVVANATDPLNPVVLNWDYWAKLTGPGGRATIPLSSEPSLVEIITEHIEDITNSIDTVEVRARHGLGDWLVGTEPPSFRTVDVADGVQELKFDVTLSPPAGASPGLHSIDFEVNGDGVAWSIRSARITMDESCTPAGPPPTPTALPTATDAPPPTPLPTWTPNPTATPLPGDRVLYMPSVLRGTLGRRTGSYSE